MLSLMLREDAKQRRHDLREFSNGLRYGIATDPDMKAFMVSRHVKCLKETDRLYQRLYPLRFFTRQLERFLFDLNHLGFPYLARSDSR